MATALKRLVNRLVADGDLYQFSQLNLGDKHVVDNNDGILLALCYHYVNTYGVLPSVDTLQQKNHYTPAPDPWKAYWDEVRERTLQTTLNRMADEVKKTASTLEVDKALTLAETVIGQVRAEDTHSRVTDLKVAAMPLYFDHYKRVNQGLVRRYPVPWPTLQAMSGGAIAGDFISIVGRPGTGKTWLMLLIAHHLVHLGHKVLFVTTEMPVSEIVFRYLSIFSKVNPNHVSDAELTSKEKVDVQLALKRIAKIAGELKVIDGNKSSTVAEVYGYAKSVKSDVVMIDGAYLLQHPDPKINRYLRVAENVEAMKRVTSEMEIPTYASFQFNRGAKKEDKRAKDVGLEDVGYTDVIGQISSLAMGLFETDDDTVSALAHRYVKVMKGRKGEAGGFYLSWDFNKMDLYEIDYGLIKDNEIQEKGDSKGSKGGKLKKGFSSSHMAPHKDPGSV